MPKDLKTFVKDNQKFLKIKSGETFVGVYVNYVVGPNRFDPDGKETVSYKFKYLDSEKTIIWNNASTKVADTMAQFSPGETLQISRTGSGPSDTKYEIVALGEPAGKKK
ncbi:MAG TPA: hypothetical protein VD994_03525 [Prosthecobacter sp.]|nr:hypothetical protein [Prosthecobacter sp.]